MKIHLPPHLRHAFDVAHALLPAGLREPLRQVVREVRAVPDLDRLPLRLSDGTVCRAPRKGVIATFSLDMTSRLLRGWLLVREDAESGAESFLVALWLHEFAHVVRVHEDLDRACEVEDGRSEASAWLQVAAWAMHDASGYDVGEVIAIAIRSAYEISAGCELAHGGEPSLADGGVPGEEGPGGPS